MRNKTAIALCAILATLALVASGLLLAAPAKPKSVIHVITVKWKADAKPEQIQAALTAAENMNYPGLKNVWTKTLKIQAEGYNNVIVMEFDSAEAFKAYAGSEAQKKWYEVYQAVREESRTHDVSN